MTNEEIKDEINGLYEKNNTIMKEGLFILNITIQQNNERIAELQKMCTHKYCNEKCIYCGKNMK